MPAGPPRCLTAHPELADLIGRLRLGDRSIVRADSATDPVLRGHRSLSLSVTVFAGAARLPAHLRKRVLGQLPDLGREDPPSCGHGWLVVLPRRHLLALDELSHAEAEALGPLLRAVTAALSRTG
jgi:hypothetical protein